MRAVNGDHHAGAKVRDASNTPAGGPVLVLLSACLTFMPAAAQTEGRAALEKFQEWKRLPANTELRFGDAMFARLAFVWGPAPRK